MLTQSGVSYVVRVENNLKRKTLELKEVDVR